MPLPAERYSGRSMIEPTSVGPLNCGWRCSVRTECEMLSDFDARLAVSMRKE